MTSAYDRNIDRLRSRSAANTQKAISQSTNMAQREGDRGIREAQKIGDKLAEFSSILREERKQDIIRKKEKGRLAAIEQSNICLLYTSPSPRDRG